MSIEKYDFYEILFILIYLIMKNLVFFENFNAEKPHLPNGFELSLILFFV